jgi:hypothetical protein
MEQKDTSEQAGVKSCNCTHCVNYEFYKWAVVMECWCACHTSDGMTGHEGLCCSVPNGLKKNNPHENLKEAKYYKDILDKWMLESEVETT